MGDRVPPPATLKGKELEKLCMLDASWHDARHRYAMSRYGVQVSFRNDEQGERKLTPLASLPDFEGVLPPSGRQFMMDAKVTSSASFSLHSYLTARQLSHMLNRADYGAICFLLIHFNERVLKRSTNLAATYAFPIHRNHTFWQECDCGEVKSIGKLDCLEYGVEVVWWMPDRCRTARPDLLSAVRAVRERVHHGTRASGDLDSPTGATSGGRG